LLFLGKNGYTNLLQYYVIRTLPVLFAFVKSIVLVYYRCDTRNSAACAACQ